MNPAREKDKPRWGKCHICGLHRKLSFEHVPPESAFNDQPVVQIRGDKLFSVHPEQYKRTRGRISQRGAGAFTICDQCNNKTGAWYGKDYARFACQGIELLEHARAAPSLCHTFHIRPLPVIKQIYCMFLSANSPGFAAKNPKLVRAVLNWRDKFFSPALRIFMYFNVGEISRQAGITGVLNMATGAYQSFSEISFPPFGYILSVTSRAPEQGLQEITHFGRVFSPRPCAGFDPPAGFLSIYGFPRRSAFARTSTCRDGESER